MWKVAAEVLWSSNLQRLLLAELKISLLESFLQLEFLPIITQKLFPVCKLTQKKRQVDIQKCDYNTSKHFVLVKWISFLNRK